MVRRVLVLSLILFVGLGSTKNAYSQSSGNQYYLPEKDYFRNAEFLNEFGVDGFVPFGSRAGTTSELKLNKTGTELKSDTIDITNKQASSIFKKVTYFFQDSTMYKLRLLPNNPVDIEAYSDEIKKVFKANFDGFDYANSNETVYSNSEYRVTINYKYGYLDVISLAHTMSDFNLVRKIGLLEFKKADKFWYSISENEKIGLNFYVQITKDNNLQVAFKLYYSGEPGFTFNEVMFQATEQRRFDVNPEYFGNEPHILKVTRCFIDVHAAKEILDSATVNLFLNGDNSIKKYRLPAYQLYSLKTALSFYEKNANHPFNQ